MLHKKKQFHRFFLEFQHNVGKMFSNYTTPRYLIVLSSLWEVKILDVLFTLLSDFALQLKENVIHFHI
jgi:hypothetical protein